MKQLTCSFCGSRHVAGYLWGDESLRICRSCRDDALSYLKMIEVPLIESNPFVADLCIGSHVVESAWWEFYDSVNQTKGHVVKTIHPKNRGMGLTKHQNQWGPAFYTTPHFAIDSEGEL